MKLLSACLGVALWSVAAAAQDAPRFQVEPFWPKPLPENWILGQVSGIAVAPDDTIWIVHRPATLVDDEKGATLIRRPRSAARPRRRCSPSTPTATSSAPGAAREGYDWPKSEHGIHVDREGNVWLAGNSQEDHQILKFSPDGKFLQQIGKPGAPGGSNGQTQLGSPAHMITDDAANELYVADGYQNRRIIVFDTKNGAYKRHWGAYGKAPPPDDKLPPYRPDAAPSQSFGNPVHCVRLANDGLVYVCDRANDRIQVFRKDGTFVKEFPVEPATLQNGSVWDLVLSTDPGSASSSSPTAPTGRSTRSGARTANCSANGAATAARPGSSSGCTTSRSTRRETSTPPRSASAAGRRSSGRCESSCPGPRASCASADPGPRTFRRASGHIELRVSAASRVSFRSGRALLTCPGPSIIPVRGTPPRCCGRRGRARRRRSSSGDSAPLMPGAPLSLAPAAIAAL